MIIINSFNGFGVDPSVLAKSLSAIKQDTPNQKMWADQQFKILKRYIQLFEESLDSEHEVGIMMTNFGQSVLMQVRQVSYEYPVLMVFKGYVNGQKTVLIQHVNQLNFMLTSVKIQSEQPKRRIGFTNDNE